MSTPADELNQQLDEATNQLGRFAERVNADITDGATTVAGTVAPSDPVAGAVIATAGPVVGGIVQGQVDGANGVVRGAADYATGAANAGSDIAGGYMHAGRDLANTAGNVINDQVNAYRHAGSDVLDGFEHGDPVGGVVHAGGDLLAGGAHQVNDLLTGVGHAAGDVGSGALHGAEDLLNGVAKGAEDIVSGTVKQFSDVTHGVLEGAAHGLKSLFGGGESKDEILKKFGHESGEKLDASRAAASKGRAQLQQLASEINAGNAAAIGKADDILKPGESGLAYFDYFLPAYNAWTGSQQTTAALRKTYEAEFGMSFTDYSGDAKLLTDVASALNNSEQSLQNAYNALIPTWQGPAAANFEAKLKIFFSGATTTQQTVSGTAQEITALVGGLQKLVLAKAEIANELYADTLTPGIDGEMAKTMVKVAMDDAPDDMKRVVLSIFHLACHGRHCWDSDSYYSSDCLDDPSRQAAINAAADWCNSVLMPQTETRIQALIEACNETSDRIQAAFAKLVSDIKSVQDPFAGMETADANNHISPVPWDGGQNTSQQHGTGTQTGTGTQPGVPTGTQPGVPTGTQPGVPTGTQPGVPTGTQPGVPTGTQPGVPTGTHPGVPTGTGTAPQQHGTDPGTGTNPGTGAGTNPGADQGTDPGTTRPTGLPHGAHWIPQGVPLPKGWHRAGDGEVLPKGWHLDPKTGLPVAGTGGVPSGDPFVNHGRKPKQDVHHRKDGSVSIGRSGDVTISPEGKNGAFTVTETDPNGTVRTYRVHFDQNGDPVVHEVSTNSPGMDSSGAHTAASQFGDPFVNHGGDSNFNTGSGPGTTGPGSGTTGTSASGLSGVTGQTGQGSSQLNLSGQTGHHGHHSHDGMHTQLQEGAHVGVDNAMGAGPGTTGAASPVAGSAAASSGGSQGGGAVGGFPLGAGRGAGGGGEQEHNRRYAQRGDVVGEEDLEEWQRMGPVLGDE